MKNDYCYLPNGIRVTVTPAFEGFRFKVDEYSRHSSFPSEWTISLSTEVTNDADTSQANQLPRTRGAVFTKPTLENDALCLSSISAPLTNDLKPYSAPTRQVAMLLWTTFLWYFHEPEPSQTSQSFEIRKTRSATRDWRLKIKRRGILSGKMQLRKLERMGLIAAEPALVCAQHEAESPWEMFVSQRSFWQLDPRIYLFTFGRAQCSPVNSPLDPTSLDSFGPGFPLGAGPSTSGVLLPSYYPYPPTQYTYSGNVRHPVRLCPPLQGEVLYTRYVPSGGQYMIFRVPVLPAKGLPRPRSPMSEIPNNWPHPDLCLDSNLMGDIKLLHRWINDQPGDMTFTCKGPIAVQTKFLEERLTSQDTFPALACWGSTPVAYFEIFWVLEDAIGPLLGDVDDWDRGVRCLLGNSDFQQPDKLAILLSSLVHCCWLHDPRTAAVIFDVRADNKSLLSCLERVGFYRDRAIVFPHQHNVIMRIQRKSWIAPVI